MNEFNNSSSTSIGYNNASDNTANNVLTSPATLTSNSLRESDTSFQSYLHSSTSSSNSSTPIDRFQRERTNNSRNLRKMTLSNMFINYSSANKNKVRKKKPKQKKFNFKK
jgi:hypothetical protein